jgi:gas vesicle protein GvpN
MEQVLELEADKGFVETERIKGLAHRALSYLQAGYAVHLSGSTGTGKTTLAMHLAKNLGNPVSLIYGDDEFGSSELVGSQTGYQRKKLVDNFIHSVLKTEEQGATLWVDNRVTEACRNGHTLIYDEFNRSKPEANNALLSVLEEGILTLPPSSGEMNTYIKVHQDFRAIFTSNPEEYVGVHKAQDALLDRMVTIHLDYYDRETEIQIVAARTGLANPEAAKLVDLIRALRQFKGKHPILSLRSGIVIGKVSKMRSIELNSKNPQFLDVCIDVLASKNGSGSAFNEKKALVTGLVRQFFNEKEGHSHGKKRKTRR